MVFCFVQNYFFGQHESQNYFLSRKARIFFPEFNIRLYNKNSESDYFFFAPPKSEYFFQQHWESEYFFQKKTITLPPFKLNGRSLRQYNIFYSIKTCIRVELCTCGFNTVHNNQVSLIQSLILLIIVYCIINFI